MTALALWIAASPLIGCLAGCCFRTGMVDRTSATGCNQVCNQGRNCTCGRNAGAKP